jgi:predicted nuclease of predicted toxin-antitoxin system
MKFLLDENAEHRLAYFLRELGHDYPHSLSDREVLAIACQEQRILITNDRSDFGELVFRYHAPHAGVILFSLKIGDLETKQNRLQQVITEHVNQLHHFVVITPPASQNTKNYGHRLFIAIRALICFFSTRTFHMIYRYG